MLSIINTFFGHYLTISEHLMTLKIKEKMYFDKTVFEIILNRDSFGG